MKKLLGFLLIIGFLGANAQNTGGVFVTSKQQTFNLMAAATGQKGLDGKSKYLDTVNFKIRAFTSVAEANSYLPTLQRSVGQMMYVNTGGSLSLGIITGGTNQYYYYKDGIADGDLVVLFSIPTLQQVLTAGNQMTTNTLIKGTGATTLNWDSLTNINWRHKGFFRIQSDNGQATSVFNQSVISFTAGDSVVINTPSTNFSVMTKANFYKAVHSYDTLFLQGNKTKSDSTTYKPLAINPSTGAVVSMTSWPTGSGGGGGGAVPAITARIPYGNGAGFLNTNGDVTYYYDTFRHSQHVDTISLLNIHYNQFSGIYHYFHTRQANTIWVDALDDSYVNMNGVRDVVHTHGYNTAGDGSSLFPAISAFAFAEESLFNSGAGYQNEHYFWVRARNGAYIRVLAWNIDDSTGVSYAYSHFNGWQFFGTDSSGVGDSLPYFGIGQAGIVVQGIGNIPASLLLDNPYHPSTYGKLILATESDGTAMIGNDNGNITVNTNSMVLTGSGSFPLRIGVHNSNASKGIYIEGTVSAGDAYTVHGAVSASGLSVFYNQNTGSGDAAFQAWSNTGNVEYILSNGGSKHWVLSSKAVDQYFRIARNSGYTNGGEMFVIDENGRIGLFGVTAPVVSLETSDTTAWKIPVGTAAQAPAGAAGYIRQVSDSTTANYAAYQGFNEVRNRYELFAMKPYVDSIAALFFGGAASNIYNTDGTLTGNRQLNGASHTIAFGQFSSQLAGFTIYGGAFSFIGGGHFQVNGALAVGLPEGITSGTATTLANTTTWVVVNPATTLATHTITLPSFPVAGEIIKIFFGGTITSGAVVTILTISPNSGQSIIQTTAPTTGVAGQCLTYIYDGNGGNKWYQEN